MGQTQPDAGDAFERLLLLLALYAADDLGPERFRLPEHLLDARLQLIGQKLLVRSDIEDWRRSVVEPFPNNIEHRRGLAALRRRDTDHPFPAMIAKCARERSHIGRETRITRSRPAGLRAIDNIFGSPFVRMLAFRRPCRDRDLLVKSRSISQICRGRDQARH